MSLGSEAGEGSEAQVLWRLAEGAGVVQSGEKEAERWLYPLSSCVKGGYSQVGVGRFFQVTGDRTQS